MISIVVGTRPETIKMAPIILELQERKMDFRIVHTGQHYDLELSQIFFEELGLPPADNLLEVGSGTQAYQTGMSLMKLEEVFIEERPDLILVEGDTNAVDKNSTEASLKFCAYCGAAIQIQDIAEVISKMVK